MIHGIPRRLRAGAILVILSLVVALPALAQPAAPGAITAVDVPDDRGHAIDLSWQPSPDDDGSGSVTAYLLHRAPAGGEFERVSSISPAGANGGDLGFTDVSDEIENGHTYLYRVVAQGPSGVSAPSESSSAVAEAQWFNKGRWRMLVAVLVLSTAIIYWIQRAQTSDSRRWSPSFGPKGPPGYLGRPSFTVNWSPALAATPSSILG